ncbi:hypothetical protein FI667_g8806, partial [Globisporangium splendens]
MESLLDTDTPQPQFSRYRNFAARLTARSITGNGGGDDATTGSVADTTASSVELSEDETAELTRLADTLLANLRATYETHALTNRYMVDKSRWKALKKREQLVVYKQRVSKSAAATLEAIADAFSSSTVSSTSEHGAVEDDKPMPHVMLTGSVAGQVQDVLYGLASATTTAMKFKSSYCQDAVLDAQVLATIQGPTIDDPFRFLGIKWVLLNHSTSTKKRDLVYLETTGRTTLSSGESVAYHIEHSVTLHGLSSHRRPTQLSRLSSSGPVRAKMSVGQLFRQRSSGATIDVFMSGYYDPCGDMLQFLAMNLAADQMLHAATSVLECASLKKLSWAAHLSGRKRRATTILRATQRENTHMLQEMEDVAHEVDAEHYNGSGASICSICSRRFGRVLQRGGASCTICAQIACSRCIVTKKLSFSQNDGVPMATAHIGGDLGSSGGPSNTSMKEICQKPLNFCIPCVVKCNNESATHVAIEEMLDQQAGAAGVDHLGSTSSSMTPRQVFMAATARRRATRAGSASPFTNTTPRFTYGGGSTTTPRPKAFSMASTTSSNTSSVILYEEPTAAHAAA